MKFFFLYGGLLLALLLTSRAWAANELSATIEISSLVAKQIATNASPSPRNKIASRPVFHAAPHEKLTLHWTLEGKDAPMLEDVLVHFYVARLERPGQKGPPELQKPENIVLEGALTMDFKEKNSAQSTIDFRVGNPGVYFARIEARHKDLSPLEEPTATIELEIK